jgi:hypothetical protein
MHETSTTDLHYHFPNINMKIWMTKLLKNDAPTTPYIELLPKYI